MIAMNENMKTTAFLCLMIWAANFIFFHPLLNEWFYHFIIIMDTLLAIQQTVSLHPLVEQQK